MGVYGLLVFSFFSGITAAIQAARDGLLGKWWAARWLPKLPQRLLAVPGMFGAAFLGGYTGVLLTATSVPLWSRSKLLRGIFLSSAISTGSALISLLLRLFRAPTTALHKLERMEWAALLIEMEHWFPKDKITPIAEFITKSTDTRVQYACFKILSFTLNQGKGIIGADVFRKNKKKYLALAAQYGKEPPKSTAPAKKTKP